MNFNMDWKQGLVAMFFFVTVMPMTAMAIYGMSKLEATNEIEMIFTNIWILLLIPITFYIAFFTKYNNPFKEIKNE